MRSMTGYGRCTLCEGEWTLTAEIRTVNHRFLDLSIRLPRSLTMLEETVRAAVTEQLSRGHADISLTVEKTGASMKQVVADPALAAAYLDAAKSIADATAMPMTLNLFDLMQMDGVLQTADAAWDLTILQPLCRRAVQVALTELVAMRAREGDALQADLRLHLNAVADLRDALEKLVSAVPLRYQTKLKERLATLIADAEVDEARFTQEVALMADRCAVDEELSRLTSHIAQMRAYLAADYPVGKQMDFLTQEMNREANTIGSKANDADMAQLVVRLKSELEKLREQIQNVE